MNEMGTIHDAVAVFSALQGDQVIELLSRLETEDAQRLLATASKRTPTVNELDHASVLLRTDLNQSDNHFQNRQAEIHTDDSNAEYKKPNQSRKLSKRSGKPRSKHSLEFLIDMPGHDIRRLLSNVSTACWAPALQSESTLVRDTIFNNVAPAIERLLRQEIQSLDCNSQVARVARQKIFSIATDLDLLKTAPPRRKAG